MQSPSKLIRPLLALAALAAVVVAASGCGTTSADAARGRVLFVQKCGTCHTLAQAGTTAQIGPNLDDAFAAAREAGENGDTIEGIVKAQVEYPRPDNGNPAVSMPADIVSGQDLDDVAAYVGTYAGVPGAAPPKVPGGPGAQVFANNGCGGCHTLAAAELRRRHRPQPRRSPARPDARRWSKRSIVDPNKRNRQGLPGERDAAELRRDDLRQKNSNSWSNT